MLTQILVRRAEGAPIASLGHGADADSPEMHRIYRLAEATGVPVLIHFEFETYNTGLEHFEDVPKAYPSVNLIGHAQTWLGNIGADLNPLDLYPKDAIKKGGLTERLLWDCANMCGDLSAGSGVERYYQRPGILT